MVKVRIPHFIFNGLFAEEDHSHQAVGVPVVETFGVCGAQGAGINDLIDADLPGHGEYLLRLLELTSGVGVDWCQVEEQRRAAGHASDQAFFIVKVAFRQEDAEGAELLSSGRVDIPGDGMNFDALFEQMMCESASLSACSTADENNWR